MANVVVTTRGYEQLRRALQKLLTDKTYFKEIHRGVADMVAKEARSTAPYDTGALMKSIKSKPTTRRAAVKAGGTNLVPYAAPIHWGWPARNIGSNPWMQRAADTTQDRAMRMLTDGLIEATKRAGITTPAEED